MNAYAERLESSNALGSVTEVLPLLDVNPEASALMGVVNKYGDDLLKNTYDTTVIPRSNVRLA
jgi:hypothetical protein